MASFDCDREKVDVWIPVERVRMMLFDFVAIIRPRASGRNLSKEPRAVHKGTSDRS